MNRFDGLKRWAWSILVMSALAFVLTGCEGSTGPQGPAGPAGADGQDGLDGTDTTAQAAQLESCATCHSGAGDEHQAVYDRYVDDSVLTLTFTSVSSTGTGPYVVELAYSITKNGLPYIDAAGLPSMDQKRFEAVTFDSATGEYLNECRLNENHVALGGGQYTVQDTDCPYAPEAQTVAPAGAHVYGYIAQGNLFEHSGGTGAELPAGTHVHLYDDVASAALAFGTADVTDPASYVSAANVSGCTKCHGTPYLKHGYRDPIVAGIPDFASCKSCHYDNRNGNHRDWQQMVDRPLDWATGVAPAPGEYDYTANVMNDTHMSHAMEFPYPQSMQNCDTCHQGKLATVLDDTQFTAETCLSCHPLQGTDAWPGETYAQGNRAPALDYLWQRGADLTFHQIGSTCTDCHGNDPVNPTSRPFTAYHTGYDVNITNATGQRYSALYSVSVDQITLAGNLLTVNFSSSDPAVLPEVLVSFYGWDSKQFIVASHSSDGSTLCTSRSGNPGGCRMEYTPETAGGSANPLFTEEAGSVLGSWMVTLDMAAYVPTAVLPETIPELIASGVIKKVEVTVTPELNLEDVGGADVDVVLTAAGATFDLGTSLVVDDYFKGVNAVVSTARCNVCHDALASSFHSESGRGGDGIEVCKNCHVTTSPGSHLEMASRAIDNYVHAIHSFQNFDVADVFNGEDANGDPIPAFDPVFAKRYDLHINHVFPNFTIRNCEACHATPGDPVDPADPTGPEFASTIVYNVPNQAESMPGVLAASDSPLTWYAIVGGLAVEDPAGRSIGSVPELVTGPASRACGACHRSRMINRDLSGNLASFNAHTDAFGTLAENDAADTVLYGIIEDIMSLFQ